MSGFEPAERSLDFGSEAGARAYARYLAPSVFEPWAEVLLDAVAIAPASRVLDVASGTGVVARAAALRAGSAGRVLASDVSAAMLTQARAAGVSADAAPIDYHRASAEALPFPDGCVDVAVCQQGLQFFADPAAALREMRRVLCPGGMVGIAVWASGHPIEPFSVYADELAAVGASAPFPGAFDASTFTMAPRAVRALLGEAGFGAVEVAVAVLEVSWPDAASAAAGVLGPFAAVVQALDGARRSRLDLALRRRFGPSAPGEPVRRTTAAVIAHASAAR